MAEKSDLLAKLTLRQIKELTAVEERLHRAISDRTANDSLKGERFYEHAFGSLTFRYETVRCGKKNCSRCPHGPYWYVYWKEEGRTRSRYVGRTLPVGVSAQRTINHSSIRSQRKRESTELAIKPRIAQSVSLSENQDSHEQFSPPRIIEIRQFLDGHPNIHPSDAEICSWIQFCYDNAFYADGARLFALVNPAFVDDERYDFIKKIADVCQLRRS